MNSGKKHSVMVQNHGKLSTIRFGNVYSVYTELMFSWISSYLYFQGLGTSDSTEGREYFSNLGKHKKDFVWADDEDNNAIELAFSKKKTEERKNWLRQFEVAQLHPLMRDPISPLKC